MINPFLTTNTWAMHETKLRSIAEKMTTLTIDPFDDDSNGAAEPAYQVVNGIAIFSLTGPLLKYDNFWTSIFGGTSTLATKQNYQAALDDPSVQGTLLIVDSPGGTVSGTGDLADVIANSEKPVWAYISDQCASAAYWITSQADKVFCNPTASVGSIGVYCVLQDTSKMYADAGVKVNLVKAGDYKGTGVDGVPITDEQIADEQREVNDIYAMFIEAVARGREMTAEQSSGLATGQMWIASQSLELGLVDGIASLDDVFANYSGEIMANKISPFSASKAGKANAATAPVTPAAEAVVETPTVVAEPVAVAADPVAEPVAVIAPITPVQTDADKLTQSFNAGVASERARFASIKEIAPDHPQFVSDQFNAGADKATAAIAYTKLLASELKTAKASITNQPEAANKAIAVASVESRDNKGTALRSLFSLKH